MSTHLIRNVLFCSLIFSQIDSKAYNITFNTHNHTKRKQAKLTSKAIWQKIREKASTSIAHQEMLENYLKTDNEFANRDFKISNITNEKLALIDSEIKKAEKRMRINNKIAEKIKDALALNAFIPEMKTLHKKYKKTYEWYKSLIKQYDEIMQTECETISEINHTIENFFDAFGLTREERGTLRDSSNTLCKFNTTISE